MHGIFYYHFQSDFFFEEFGINRRKFTEPLQESVLFEATDPVYLPPFTGNSLKSDIFSKVTPPVSSLNTNLLDFQIRSS